MGMDDGLCSRRSTRPFASLEQNSFASWSCNSKHLTNSQSALEDENRLLRSKLRRKDPWMIFGILVQYAPLATVLEYIITKPSACNVKA